MSTIDLAPGLELHYFDHNQLGKRTVLLLHGLGVTGESWQLQIPTLIEVDFRVLAPDARGFGRSSYPGRTSPVWMAEDMAGLLRRLHTGSVGVIGISMGGTTALQLALDYPELVDRLVLVNTFACLRPDRPGVWLYFAIRYLIIHALGLPAQAHLVARRLFPDPEQDLLRHALYKQVIQANLRGYRAAMRALARFDVRDRLKEIKVPTLVITGERDSTVPQKIQRYLVEAIPGARQVTIAAAGHAVIVDQAEAFNQSLLDFLQE